MAEKQDEADNYNPDCLHITKKLVKQAEQKFVEVTAKDSYPKIAALGRNISVIVESAVMESERDSFVKVSPGAFCHGGNLISSSESKFYFKMAILGGIYSFLLLFSVLFSSSNYLTFFFFFLEYFL